MSVKTRNILSPNLGEAFQRLGTLMRDIGLHLSVWNARGERVENQTPGCDFCRMVESASSMCRSHRQRAAERVLESGEDVVSASQFGCCVVATPVRRRRRIVGAAVASYPPLELLESEHFVRMCSQLELDYRVMRSLAGKTVRHSDAASRDFLLILKSLLESEQSEATARGELNTLSSNLATTYEELSLLYRISGSMRVTQQPQEFLETICNELREVMSLKAATALVYAHPPVTDKDLVISAGGMPVEDELLERLAARELTPGFARSHRAVLDNEFAERAERIGIHGIDKLLAVPLVDEDDYIGMLIGVNKAAGDFDSVDLKLINAIASQAGIFLANSRLYAEMQDLLMGVLHALTATIDAKDPYTCGHSQRVAIIAQTIAEMFEFPPEKVRRIYLAGLLHDIGKIGVPEATLCKSGRLTEEEYANMKRHPVIGARILGGIRQLDDVVVGILHHHERYDGRGYPDGLAGEDIPIEGRIVGLSDCFDAMTSNRTYRKALALDVAVTEIRKHNGTQFDPRVVEKLLSLDLDEFVNQLYQPAQPVFPMNQSGEDSE